MEMPVLLILYFVSIISSVADLFCSSTKKTKTQNQTQTVKETYL